MGGQRVRPQPLPQTFDVKSVRGPNGPLIVVGFQGVCGEWVTYLDAGSATELANDIASTVASATGGLIVPRAGSIT